MLNHSSATERKEISHVNKSTKNKTLRSNGTSKRTVSNGLKQRNGAPQTITDARKRRNGTSKTTVSKALRRRAQSLIKNKSIDAQSRAIIRYGLETNDPWLAELVRRADAGETIIDTIDFSQTPVTSEGDSDEEKIEALAEIICRAGDEPSIKSAALLVLMATLENSSHPKALANTAKHFAFAVLEAELLAGRIGAREVCKQRIRVVSWIRGLGRRQYDPRNYTKNYTNQTRITRTKIPPTAEAVKKMNSI